MLSSVLNSKRAVQMNILIIRAFVKLREVLATHKDLARKMEDQQKEHGARINAVYEVRQATHRRASKARASHWI